MKQSSLDEPGLGMEYEGAEVGNNTTNNESEGEANVFMNQTVLTQLRTYCQNENNQPPIRPDTPQLTKGKSNIFINTFQFQEVKDIIYSKQYIFHRFTMDTKGETKGCRHIS